MITTTDDVKKIYRSRNYQAVDIIDHDNNFFEFRIEFKGQELARLCKRQYETEIVYHLFLLINNDFIRKGHGRKIHNRECEAYKNHGIKKIKLFAVSDGVCVWLKLGFTINYLEETNKNIEPQLLLKYREYLCNIHFPDDPTTVKILMRNCKSIKSIVSKEFKKYTLPESPDKQCFTDYLSNTWNGFSGIEMSKDI